MTLDFYLFILRCVVVWLSQFRLSNSIRSGISSKRKWRSGFSRPTWTRSANSVEVRQQRFFNDLRSKMGVDQSKWLDLDFDWWLDWSWQYLTLFWLPGLVTSHRMRKRENLDSNEGFCHQLLEGSVTGLLTAIRFRKQPVNFLNSNWYKYWASIGMKKSTLASYFTSLDQNYA